ncbi:hypothetical protein KC332_g3336 [Hortaea werneckii]|uniref:Uncharacterized protein n=1 Tax=Hortaea werneckii TaxID=91943 RepID=A0A3M7IJ62_HORWE|nr:hypothetical protein KC358_g6843 [Hortaea werneckii]KAI6848840.1 hypothetical protein KC350_g2847 [Hortaea werneckii]KAI6930010.1 hypothetical protein KC348_g7696 [Hortaea werneckii]KAI6935168.1 hypothetical protein KC341_g7100 [Hortaea werneckii]KAI6966372.1 hypothetical protein KC321_g9596 [Hortaea werneckii]
MSASEGPPEKGILLRYELPDSSEAVTVTPSSNFKPRQRPGYARIPSVSFGDERALKPNAGSYDEDDIAIARQLASASQGSEIATASQSMSSKPPINSAQSSPRAQAIHRPKSDQHMTGPNRPLISPPSTGGWSGTTHIGDSPESNTPYAGAKRFGKQSTTSLHSSFQPSIYAKSDTGLLSIRSRYDEWGPHESCRSRKLIKRKIGGCPSVTILVLAVFSTALSAIFLVIALLGPRYRRLVHTNGPLTPSSAAFLTSFLAKMIELSYITVLVAFIGQALARRAFRQEQARGVTLAELSMRGWVQQPGTLFTQWESVRYAGVSILGQISLLGAVNGMLYTSAATALVQPQLKWPDWEQRDMRGLVRTKFANPDHIQEYCKTPIQEGYDVDYRGSTCIQLEHAAMGYHNYFGYLSTWTDLTQNGTGTPDPGSRPKGFALLNDNTTISAPWVEQANVTQLYEDTGFVVNNVSMALPHPSVIGAALGDESIMQPAELGGLGSYHIRASVSSPVVHVLCVTMNEEMLKSFVYEKWDNATIPVDTGSWPTQLSYTDPYLGGTDFDDVFQWGPNYGLYKYPPVFSKLPIDYNTIMNDTTGMPYGRDSIYILGKGGDLDSNGSPTNKDNYALCQLKVSQTPYCSTHYNASSNGGTLEAICTHPTEPSPDPLQYIKSSPDAPSGNDTLVLDWVNIASEWGRSLALNTGVVNAIGSNARLLTQLILTASSVPTSSSGEGGAAASASLNPALPSMAEALAVMAGCTLVVSALDSPFTPFWNYTLPTLTPGQYQYFNASIRAQQYASGGTVPYQKAFHVVLMLTCLMNVMVLGYFGLHRDWYTDFSEPCNLFSLAVNSPPSTQLAGSCGGGPAGKEFKVCWKVNVEGEHVFLESVEGTGSAVEDGDEEAEGSPGLLRRRRRLSEGLGIVMSPLKRATDSWEVRRSRQ